MATVQNNQVFDVSPAHVIVPTDDSVVNQTKPTLATLEGDQIDRFKFYNINDKDFTELLTPLEGIGISEFFALYEDLKNQIPGGNADLILDLTGTNSILTELETVVSDLKSSLLNGTPSLASVSQHLGYIIQGVSTLTSLIQVSSADNNTHSYLVANSLPFIEKVNDKFQAVFDAIVALLQTNQTLSDQVSQLQAQNALLQNQIDQLNTTIKQLTAPQGVAGFEVVPDSFAVPPNVTTTVQFVVCGSTDFTVAAGKGFDNIITNITQKTGGIYTADVNQTMVWPGPVAYLTVTSNDVVNEFGKATDQVIFTIANVPVGSLTSDVGTDIIMQTEAPGSDDTEWRAEGNRNYATVIISGVKKPYTIKTNSAGQVTTTYPNPNPRPNKNQV